MERVLLTGSQGFIGSYICNELLRHGYEVIGIDNYSKYGNLTRAHDNHPNFKFFELDIVKDFTVFSNIAKKFPCQYIIASAAMIGGISYFHKYAYDLLTTNERINANTFDIALEMNQSFHNFKKLVCLSSSMVFESAINFPSLEYEVEEIPPPKSTYGFQKLASEYFCKGVWEQYKLPTVIVRPFNCVGIGEDKSIKDDEITSGNRLITLSHVIPDIINKILSGQDPLEILGSGTQIRCYTHGKDIAKGLRLAMESKYINTSFNIATSEAITVIELANKIWNKICPEKPFRYTLIDGFTYDIQTRLASTQKALDELGFEATISLDESLDEVISYLKTQKV